MRASGILYPISSLPSKYGIGCFSREAYEFVDFLKEAGQTYWQVLPFGPTGYGDSPYQSFSTFAGNPYFISLEGLIEDGLLTKEECDSIDWGSDPEAVDYGALYENRFKVLRLAYDRFVSGGKEAKEFRAFCHEEKDWLEDYCLFMALKQENKGAPWAEWDPPYRNRGESALAVVEEVIENTVDFFRFQQYEFMKQWKKLRRYAHGHGVKIIGDIPFYVAFDSADTWSHPEMFEFDEENIPIRVAGCPPDAFSATGQLWGNPVYDWEYLKAHEYGWWVRRLERCLDFYDVIRIDHFRGFDEYYTIPYGNETAVEGEWEKGPGMDLFRTVRKKLGDVHIIAEDLGYITETVRKLLDESGFPGMKVLQFAFDGSECSVYLPYQHIRNCVVYTGTHDNMTTRGWIESLNDHDRDFARRYINSIFTDYGQFTWDFIREAFRSVADLCIVPLQDFLVKDNSARLNSPSVAMGNWTWRVAPNFLTHDLAQSIYGLTKVYGRLNFESGKEEADGEDDGTGTDSAEDSKQACAACCSAPQSMKTAL